MTDQPIGRVNRALTPSTAALYAADKAFAMMDVITTQIAEGGVSADAIDVHCKVANAWSNVALAFDAASIR